MLLDSKEGDTNSKKPTQLDISRFESMALGDFFDGELNNWRIFRYKDGFELLLYNSPTHDGLKHFNTLDELLWFLKS